VAWFEKEMGKVIAIVGRPNVGKSTLFNRLSRSRTALVDDRPGVTRDRLYATMNYEDRQFTFIDTGGLGEDSQDPISSKIREQVRFALDEADLVLFMTDARQGLTPVDQEIARELRRARKQVFLAVNKVDGPELEHLAMEFYSLGFEDVYPISSAHGYGVKALMEALLEASPQEEEKSQKEEAAKVAVVGKPNVGKSSLINRVLGLERLVVSQEPGTTRDSVDTPVLWNGRSYLFIDTAGIRRKPKVKEKLEKLSVIKALGSLERCDVACVVLDASDMVSEQDARICGYAAAEKKGVVLVVNKWDLVKNDKEARRALERGISRRLHFLSHAPRINVSALTGEGMRGLFKKIDLTYKQYSARIGTGELNRALKEIVERHSPARDGLKMAKFYYAAQVSTRPPTIVLFMNRPELITASYERYLVNQLRAAFNMPYAPIKLVFRKRSKSTSGS